MSAFLLIAAGGAAGSVLRHLMVQAVGFPWGTLAVNVAGSFLIGLAFVALAGRGPGYLLVATGVLGGFTTFSAFSLDTLRLVESGQAGMALAYVAGSLALSLAACAAAVMLARGLA